MRPEMFCAIPPPLSDERTCCLAGFLGESRDSGRGTGLDARAKVAVLSPCYERSLGQCRVGVPDSISGLIMGEFGLPELASPCGGS